MTIVAQRFEAMRTDLNVAVQDFKSIKDNGVFNAPLDMLKEARDNAKSLLEQLNSVKGQVSDFLDEKTGGLLGSANEIIDKEKSQIAGAIEGLKGSGFEMDGVKGILENATRVTEDLIGTFTDVSSLPDKLVNGFIDSIIPDGLGSVSNSLRSLTKICRNNALGASMGFGGLNNPKCDGLSAGVGNCPPGPALNLLSGVGLGALAGLIDVGKNLLGKILALANIGFGAGLCGVFTGLTQSITNNAVVGFAAGLLVNQQGLKNNIGAVRDVAKTTIARNINASAIFPGTIKNVTTGITDLGKNQKNDKLKSSESYFGSLKGLDENWNGTEESPDISRVFNSGVIRDSSKNMLNTRPAGSDVNSPPAMDRELATSIFMSNRA